MKKMFAVPVLLILLLTLGVASVFGETEVTQAEGRGANATWQDGTFALVLTNNRVTPLGKIMIVCVGPGVGVVLKELSPDELKWSMNKVQVSTAIPAGMLIIEWETVLPTTLTHTNEQFGFVHLIHNGAMRFSSASLMVIDPQGNVVLALENGVGAVSEGVSVQIIKSP